MKRVSVLLGMLWVSLLTSTALGAERPIGDYDHSSEGFFPEVGILKNQRACPEGTTFFKNVAPGLTNGSGAGSTSTPIAFDIDGDIVTMSISWDAENLFGFSLTGGVAHIVGVTSDTNNLLYDYVNFYTDVNNLAVPAPPNTPVFSDGNLNNIEFAADVNHLDLCLAVVDTSKPVITFISPLSGDTVSGSTITVQASVIDEESGLGPVTASFYPTGDPGSAKPLTLISVEDHIYTWEWTTVDVDPSANSPVDLPPGSYTIAVTAEDLAVPVVNTQTVEITVDLINSLANCFGILGPEDFQAGGTDVFENGCEPTPLANVQVPPDAWAACKTDSPDPDCTITGIQLKPDLKDIEKLNCDACVAGYCGEYGLPDPRMTCTIKDTAGNCTGEWIPPAPAELRPLFVSTVAEPVIGTEETELVLGKYVYAYNGCFAASQHLRGGALSLLYPEWPADPPTGLVFIKTHRPANVITNGDQVARCDNIGSMNVAQAGYQPIAQSIPKDPVDRLADGTPAITLAATQECFNPPRTLTRDNGIDVSNIIETDGSDDPVAFKYQMAQMQFDALFTALDCAEGNFLRGKVKFSDVTSPVNQARAQFDNGTIAALERARDDLWAAADAIRLAKWTVDYNNCPGDALARTENLAWRMTDLIAALTP